MGLPRNIVKQFVSITNDSNKVQSESTVYGTIVEYDGSFYAKIDGSDSITPITTTTNVKAGERVLVLLKNHTATVTGNITDPAASNAVVSEIGTKVTNLDVVVADKVSTTELNAQIARIDILEADYVTVNGKLVAYYAEIETLKANDVTITGKLEANDAKIDTLESNYVTVNGKLTANEAEIEKLKAEDVIITGKLTANEADITQLKADNVEISGKLVAAEAVINALDVNYANIDFSNIGKAAMEYFYAKSGLIDNVQIGDATITGELVGVTISGNLLKGNTVMADKLVIKGKDGLYYKLNIDGGAVASEEITEEQLKNGLHGDIFIAKSITAEKISVDDLVAFDATIGGFNITKNSIYSGVKESIDNTTRGLHFGADGQVAIGDNNNFIKFYKDSDGKYRLKISMVDPDETIGYEQVQSEGQYYLLDSDMIENGVIFRNETDEDVYVYSVPYGPLYVDGDYIEFYEEGTFSQWYIDIPANSEVPYTFECDSGTVSPGMYFYINMDYGTPPTVYKKTTVDVDGDLETKIDDASKTATNFLDLDSEEGLQLGDKSKGFWSGFRTQITASAYNILNEAGEVLASYGAKIIELGKNAADAIIRLCGGKGQIAYGDIDTFTGEVTPVNDGETGMLQISSDNVEVSGDSVALRTRSWTLEGEYKQADSYMHGTTAGVQVNSPAVNIWASSAAAAVWDEEYGDYVGYIQSSYLMMDDYNVELRGYNSINMFSQSLIDIQTVLLPTDGSEYGVHINGMAFGVNKVLWSGGYYMTAGHTATLSEPISSQPHGVVLVFSRYSSDTVQDYQFNTFFVPKYQVATHPGTGHVFTITSGATLGVFATKYLYISDSKIVGNDANNQSGTGACGITYTNNGYVLRYVIGV